MRHIEKLIMQSTIGFNKVDPSSVKHKDYQEAIEAAKPSDKPEFWAKKSCKHCYGKGVIGRATTTIAGGNKIINEQVCSCASKAWQSWQKAFVEQLQKAEQKAADSRNDSDQKRKSSSIERKVASESTPPKEDRHTAERLERIFALLDPLQKQLRVLEQRRADLVQRDAVREAEDVLVARQQQQAELEQLATMQEKQADQLEEEAKQYQAMAKEANRQAAALRQRTKSEVFSEINKVARTVEQANQVLEGARRELTQVDHRLGKKSREIQRKIDRLVARRVRILEETGLDPDFTPELSISTDSPA